MHIIQKSVVIAILAFISPFAIAAPPPLPATESTLTTTPSSEATATSVSGIAAAFTNPPVTEKPSRNPLAKRADDKCYDGGSFQTSDFWGIENSFYSNYNWHWLDSATCLAWYWGTVKVCACNKYYFETTSVYDRSIGDALSHVGNCCLTSICDGGQSTISGDTGLLVDIEVVPNWGTC